MVTRRSSSHTDMKNLLEGDEMARPPMTRAASAPAPAKGKGKSSSCWRRGRCCGDCGDCGGGSHAQQQQRCRRAALLLVAGGAALFAGHQYHRHHHHNSHGGHAHRLGHSDRDDRFVRPELAAYLHRPWHPQRRSERFPSVDERVRLYMSNWYVPPCRYVPRALVDVGDTNSNNKKKNKRRSRISDDYYPEPTAKDRIHYRYEYPDLEVWVERPNFEPNSTINFVADVTLDDPMHGASGDAAGCHDVVLTTDVEASTAKDDPLHNLYVLDRDLVTKCADTPPRQNHHAVYCRDAVEMLDIVDALDGDPTQQIDDDVHGGGGNDDGGGGAALQRRSGDTTVYARLPGTLLPMRKGIAYGYDPVEQDLQLVVEALTDSQGRWELDVRNTRTPVVVRFGDTLGVMCGLPIIGKTRIAAAGGAGAADEAETEEEDGTGVAGFRGDAVAHTIATASVDPFLGVEARSLTPPTGAADGADPHAAACHPLHLHVPRLPLRTVDKSFNANYSPIVWDFHSSRSNEPLEEVLRDDVPWRKKKDVAYWRGALTGAREAFDRDVMSDEEVCDRIPRCRLVRLHDRSQLVDARLTRTVDVPMDDLPDVRLFTRGNKKMAYGEQLQHKALIVMEGNDLATGLRWSLLSQSVVLMPPPERTSWAMEEWLEPWTHYIPIHRNLTNVEEMVQWIKDNDKEARKIAERGTLFAYDLVLHPNAKKDDDDVKREILRRYRQYFVPDRRYHQ